MNFALADVGVTKDGSNKVSAWADQSGNGSNASQGTARAQPTWVSGALNGNPVIRFDGSDDYLPGTTNGYNPSGGDFSIFVTHRRNGLGVGWGAAFSFNTASGETGAPLVTWKDTTNELGMNRAGVGPTGVFVDLSSSSGDYHISTLQRKGGTNGNGGALTMRSFSTGNTLQSQATQSWNSDATGGYVLGRHWLNSNYMNGDVAEVIVYDRALSPAERTRVETYLARKYGRKEVQSDFRYTGHFYHERSGLTFAPYRVYDAELGRWISRDPIEEDGGINLYGYVGNNPIGLLDSLGLAWESTNTQNIHYNDRKTGFAFGLDTDSSGRLVPAPLGNHPFDAKRAEDILNKTRSDPSKWKNLLDMAAKNEADPAYKDKPRCGRLGRALRLFGIFGATVFAGQMASAASDYVNAPTDELRDQAALRVAEQASELGTGDLGGIIIYNKLTK